MNKWMKGKNDQRKSDGRKSGQMLKAKMWHRKGDWAETKNEGFWADSFVIKKWREKKD